MALLLYVALMTFATEWASCCHLVITQTHNLHMIDKCSDLHQNNGELTRSFGKHLILSINFVLADTCQTEKEQLKIQVYGETSTQICVCHCFNMYVCLCM